MFARRELAVLLGLCILLGAGCTPAVRWAESAYDRLAPGMTEEAVREELGEPAQIVRGDPGQPVLWVYQFESGPSTVAVVFLVILFVGLVILVAAARGGGSFGGFAGGGDDPEVAEFRVTFDGRGVVTELSPIYVYPRNQER